MNIKKEVVIGDCRLILGDCLDVMPMLGKVDAVVTDPPYGINIGSSRFVGGHKPIGSIGKTSSSVVNAKEYGKSNWDAEGLSHIQWQCIKKISDKWIIWGGNHLADIIGASAGMLIWDKKCQNGWNDTFSEMEVAFTNLITRAKGFRHLWAGALRGSEQGGNVRQHPTQKPIKLMEWCLEFIPAADSILDPFMGSGTTGVACAKMGRKFIGIELEPKYFDIACQRIKDAYAQPDMFIAPVKPLIQIEADV